MKQSFAYGKLLEFLCMQTLPQFRLAGLTAWIVE